MPDCSYNTFRGYLFEWFRRNFNRIYYMFPLRGGGGIWVQCEVASHIINSNPEIDIQRELQIYLNNPRFAAD